MVYDRSFENQKFKKIVSRSSICKECFVSHNVQSLQYVTNYLLSPVKRLRKKTLGKLFNLDTYFKNLWLVVVQKKTRNVYIANYKYIRYATFPPSPSTFCRKCLNYDRTNIRGEPQILLYKGVGRGRTVKNIYKMTGKWKQISSDFTTSG
jgi:hypothetical protein